MSSDPEIAIESAARWERPAAGLGTFLNALRARLSLWILLAGGVLAARALGSSGWPRVAAPLAAVVASIIGVWMLWGLWRHLGHPGRGGRGLGGVALVVLLVALGVDAAALMALGGLAGAVAWTSVAGSPLAAVLLAELVAFLALAPVSFSLAGLASRLGAADVRRRALRSGLLVLVTIAALAGVAQAWRRLPDPRIGAALACLVSLLAVVALAKVLGATRFLLAYLRTMHAPASSEVPLELRAWHRA